MTLLIVLACLAGYLTAGAAYGRSRTLDCYQRAVRGAWQPIGPDDSFARTATRWAVTWRVLFWPWAMVLDAIRTPVRAWLDRPITDRRERAAQLRAEAGRYDALIQACNDPTDRDLMRQGQAALREQAKGMEL